MQIAVHPYLHYFYTPRGTNYAERFRVRQEQRILSEYLSIKPGERVLDVACGNHRQYEQCTDTADFSHVFTQAKGGDQFIAHSLRMPFAPKTFRAIIGLRLGEHLTATDLEDFLWEAGRVGRPGTRVIIAVPAINIEDCRGTRWREVAVVGGDLLPVARLPRWLHRTAGRRNDRLCRTPLRKYARSRAYVLELR